MPAAVLAGLVLAGLVLAALAEAHVPLDMARGWLRRDWRKCQDPTTIAFENGQISFQGRSAKAQVWQIPLRSGPAAVDPDLRWVRECDKAPISYARARAKEIATGRDAVDLAEYPWLTWRWRVDAAADDTDLSDETGRIRGANDFAAKLGLLFVDGDDGGMQELAYVWTRQIPLETVLYQETVVIPWLLKYRLYRIVSESGPENVGRWTSEARNVRADYGRIRPRGRPGALVRVYLMADANATRGRIDSAFADVAFHRQRPEPPGASDTAPALH